MSMQPTEKQREKQRQLKKELESKLLSNFTSAPRRRRLKPRMGFNFEYIRKKKRAFDKANPAGKMFPLPFADISKDLALISQKYVMPKSKIKKSKDGAFVEVSAKLGKTKPTKLF